MNSYLTNKDNYYFFINLLIQEDYKAMNNIIYQEDNFNINAYPQNEKPILQWIHKFKTPDIVYFLASQGADVNLKSDASNYQKVEQTPLIVACRSYKPYIVKALLDCGANPNITNNFNEHALFNCLINSTGNDAHKKNVLDCIDLLLDANIDVTIKSSESGNTILDCCEFFDQMEVGRHIIDKIGSEKAKSILVSSNFIDSTSELKQYIEFKEADEEKALLENSLIHNNKKTSIKIKV